jgi:hypothetical protein
MQLQPTIRPLSVHENIYALCDENGKTIGTGTREVCEVLLFIITKSNDLRIARTRAIQGPPRSKVRSVIGI